MNEAEANCYSTAGIPTERAMENYPESADIETSSDDYATRFQGETGKYFLEVQLAKVEKQLGGYHQPTILDVGGGHGQLAIPLIEKGYSVTVTGSDACCEARLLAAGLEGSYRYHTCDMLHLPYKDDCFDIVLAFRLIPHVTRWRELIGELSRVARKAVIIDYPDLRSSNILYSLFFPVKRIFEKNTRTYTLFTRKEISGEFERNGLIVTSFDAEFTLPMVIHRAVNSRTFSQASEYALNAVGITQLLGSPIVACAQKLKTIRQTQCPPIKSSVLSTAELRTSDQLHQG